MVTPDCPHEFIIFVCYNYGMKYDINNIKEKLIKYFSSQKKAKLAFLYGSFASATPLFDSDIDIAVYLEEGYAKKDADLIWDELISLLKKDVELLILNDAKEAIAWSAIKGIPLAIKNRDFYIRYLLSVSSAAMDLAEDLEDIWKKKKELQNARH